MESAEVRNEGASAPPKVRLVLPGEAIELNGLKAGPGTYEEEGKAFASLVGLAVAQHGQITVVPLSGIYNPRAGDVVIGNVMDLGPSNWTLDIRASQPTSLHVNDVPWKVDFGDTAKYVDVRETVLCKVFKVDEVKRVFLTLSGPGLRKLEGGQVIEIAHTKVPLVVGRRGERVEKIKKWTNCRVYAAANGRIWVDGDLKDIAVVVGAIRLIEAGGVSGKSTEEALDAYLKEFGREPAPEAAPAAGFGTEGDAKASAVADEDAEETRRREAAAKEEE